jgi:hypothetical protein
LQAEQACSNARRPIVIMNVSGMAPRHRSGTQSWTRVTACSACYRLFRSLRPLRMLHCTALLARILPNDCNGLDPSLPRPAAPPSAAALVFSLIFTSAVPSFAASQPGTPPSGRAGANAAFPSTLERMYCITLIFKRARRPVAGPPSSGGSLEGEGRVGGLRPPFLANKNADAERRLSRRSEGARGGVKMSGTRVRKAVTPTRPPSLSRRQSTSPLQGEVRMAESRLSLRRLPRRPRGRPGRRGSARR